MYLFLRRMQLWFLLLQLFISSYFNLKHCGKCINCALSLYVYAFTKKSYYASFVLYKANSLLSRAQPLFEIVLQMLKSQTQYRWLPVILLLCMLYTCY